MWWLALYGLIYMAVYVWLIFITVDLIEVPGLLLLSLAGGSRMFFFPSDPKLINTINP